MEDGPIQRHPQDTMDDITSISSGREIEKVNTTMVTRSTEIRWKTIVVMVVGAGIGGVLGFMLYPLAGVTVAAAVFCIIMAAVVYLGVGTVRDSTEERKWRRAMHQLQSRNIEGQVFYVNSSHPENLIDLQEMIIR